MNENKIVKDSNKNKPAPARVKISKAALKRREERYGKAASDKMGRYN
jgi:hypothetical protein